MKSFTEFTKQEELNEGAPGAKAKLEKLFDMLDKAQEQAQYCQRAYHPGDPCYSMLARVKIDLIKMMNTIGAVWVKMKSFTEQEELNESTELNERMAIQGPNDFDSLDHWKIHKEYVMWANKQSELYQWQGDIGDAIFNYEKTLREIPKKIEYLRHLQAKWEMADERVELQ